MAARQTKIKRASDVWIAFVCVTLVTLKQEVGLDDESISIAIESAAITPISVVFLTFWIYINSINYWLVRYATSVRDDVHAQCAPQTNQRDSSERNSGNSVSKSSAPGQGVSDTLPLRTSRDDHLCGVARHCSEENERERNWVWGKPMPKLKEMSYHGYSENSSAEWSLTKHRLFSTLLDAKCVSHQPSAERGVNWLLPLQCKPTYSTVNVCFSE